MTKLEDILLPPNDFALEKLWLAMLTYDISKINELDEHCFYSEDTKKVFNAIKKTNSTEFAILAIESWLDSEIVLSLITDLVSKSDYDYIIEQLHKYKNARIIIRWIKKLENQARVLEIDEAKETIKKLDWFIQDIKKDETLEEQWLTYFEDLYSTEKIIESWYEQIDKIIQLRWWQLVVIAWRPSMWKTTVMQNIALRQSMKNKIWFISMEMTVSELIDRFICIIWWLNSYNMRNKKEHIQEIQEYLSPLLEKKLFLSEKIYNLSKIEQYIAKNELDVCYIDYLWLINYWDSKMRIIDRISEITKQLKEIAKKRNCCIVLWSQLSRDVEKRTDKAPILADLRDSWTIEQDADTVVMLYREDYYDENTEKKNRMQLFIRKNRNWELWCIELETNFSSYRLLDNWEIKKPF